ncbi:MAG: hypothetical protein ABMB14_19870 [Myxococcota bacterium]
MVVWALWAVGCVRVEQRFWTPPEPGPVDHVVHLSSTAIAPRVGWSLPVPNPRFAGAALALDASCCVASRAAYLRLAQDPDGDVDLRWTNAFLAAAAADDLRTAWTTCPVAASLWVEQESVTAFSAMLAREAAGQPVTVDLVSTLAAADQVRARYAGTAVGSWAAEQTAHALIAGGAGADPAVVTARVIALLDASSPPEASAVASVAARVGLGWQFAESAPLLDRLEAIITADPRRDPADLYLVARDRMSAGQFAAAFALLDGIPADRVDPEYDLPLRAFAAARGEGPWPTEPAEAVGLYRAAYPCVEPGAHWSGARTYRADGGWSWSWLIAPSPAAAACLAELGSSLPPVDGRVVSVTMR